MNTKRELKVSRIESQPFAVWKVKPPCKEQLELEKMFKSNEIDPSCSPDTVRQSNKLFHRFSAAVFANHYRATKAKLGLCAKVRAESEPTSNFASDGIPELGGSLDCGAAHSPTPERQHPLSIHFSNPPYWTWKYFNHEKNMDFVCVAVVALCGIRNINFEIAEDGMAVCIHYIWPTSIYRANELFHKAKNDNGTQVSIQHPKVHAFVANALESGISSNTIPKGKIVIQLPEKVQRIPSSWRKEAIVMDDTNIILLEFSAQHKEIVIEDADTSITF